MDTMITVQNRPYDYCTSGNPIVYELYSALAAANSNIYFEVKIMFTPTSNLSFAEVITIPAYPVNGTARVDIKDILHAKLQYGLPAFDADTKLATEAPNQAGLFYIGFRELVPGGGSPGFDYSEEFWTKTVIKAGLNYFKYRGDNFWQNYFEDNNPFLTWQKSGRLAALTERMYLCFFLTMDLPSFIVGEEVVPAALWQAVQVFYTDGTSSAVQYKEVPDKYLHSINFLPSGATQWELADLDPDKKIWYWKTRMEYTSAADLTKTALNDWFTYYADNRNDYNAITLNYRNSLGGIDSARVRGIIDKNLNYTFDQQDRTFLADYFNGDSISPARVIANSKENVIYKGDLGWLNKEEQERQRDMKLQRECWWEISTKWWPVLITTPSFKMKTTEDEKWSFPIEFSLAADGDRFYTPDAVNLGDRVFASNVCSAEVATSSLEVDTSGPTATVTFTMTATPGSVSHFSYQIPGIHAEPIEADLVDLPLIIEDIPLDEYHQLDIRLQCSNGIWGKLWHFNFNTVDAGSGGGGGGGGGSDNSTVGNGLADDQETHITVDGVTVFSGNVDGDGGERSFNVADAANKDVVVTIDDDATEAILITDGFDIYHGVIVGNVITFNDVDIVGGVQIYYY
jgi:hypothetical protein